MRISDWSSDVCSSNLERDFSIPITPQMREVLEAVRPLTGHLKLVFSGQRAFDKPLSDNALGVLYQRLGYKGRHVPPGCDRKRVVSGKRLTVGVALGGHRLMKKKIKITMN